MNHLLERPPVQSPATPLAFCRDYIAESSTLSDRLLSWNMRSSPANFHRDYIPQHPSNSLPQTWSTNDTTADNIENRHELFILGDDEKKVVEEVDTRPPSLQPSVRPSLLIEALRSPELFGLHFQQRRSHARQHDTFSPIAESTYPVLRLQSMVKF